MICYPSVYMDYYNRNIYACIVSNSFYISLKKWTKNFIQGNIILY